MWGIIPAAGNGARIQPLAFSKELLPVGSRVEGGVERPRAVSEYVIDRMLQGGVDKLAFVIAPGKCDILRYYGAKFGPAVVAYVVQPAAGGLCDAVFRAAPFIGPAEPVIIGLPDTVWFPEDALVGLPDDRLTFVLFPVAQPCFFDAVVLDGEGRVCEIQVKRSDPATHWIWGAIKMPGAILHELERLWRDRGEQDEYLGTLINAWIARGGVAWGARAGRLYVDVGTVGGYREAVSALANQTEPAAERLRAHRQNGERAAGVCAAQPTGTL